ncbi:hypothetical protein Ddye_032367 [Dipteronia dyeriana]|uniref:MULE transposase domain-containing protein n=1 Tax=Dipteronia dyeriana TaxID=168575 RepID=A0AAD9WPJ0_9ROSI|nr:hypothetical protein Ddye_032367 [Dipteronia dyeriana]
MYGIQILYSKAHQALQYALSLIYGMHEETFKLLPSFGYVLEQQNPGILTDLLCDEYAGISKVFPDATHMICCWHFSKNINKRFHGKDVAAVMDKAARSYIELKYNRHMEKLRNLHQNAFNYIIEAGPHKWSRVHCLERKYRVMTTNIFECINSCLKFARQLPMLTLAEFIRNMLQRWFHDRHRAAQSMCHQLTDAAHLVILKHVDKYGYMTVNPVD